MTDYWDPIDVADERIAVGFERMRAHREAALGGGASHTGWKWAAAALALVAAVSAGLAIVTLTRDGSEPRDIGL